MRDGSRGSEVRRVAALASHLSKGGISRGQNQLAELVIIESTISTAVILANDIVAVTHSWAQILLAHEIIQLTAANSSVIASIYVGKQLTGLKVCISRQILSTHFDLNRNSDEFMENFCDLPVFHLLQGRGKSA